MKSSLVKSSLFLSLVFFSSSSHGNPNNLDGDNLSTSGITNKLPFGLAGPSGPAGIEILAPVLSENEVIVGAPGGQGHLGRNNGISAPDGLRGADIYRAHGLRGPVGPRGPVIYRSPTTLEWLGIPTSIDGYTKILKNLTSQVITYKSEIFLGLCIVPKTISLLRSGTIMEAIIALSDTFFETLKSAAMKSVTDSIMTSVMKRFQ